jgi:hypothetical protein
MHVVPGLATGASGSIRPCCESIDAWSLVQPSLTTCLDIDVTDCGGQTLRTPRAHTSQPRIPRRIRRPCAPLYDALPPVGEEETLACLFMKTPQGVQCWDLRCSMLFQLRQ